jgi:hypothetical protein
MNLNTTTKRNTVKAHVTKQYNLTHQNQQTFSHSEHQVQH